MSNINSYQPYDDISDSDDDMSYEDDYCRKLRRENWKTYCDNSDYEFNYSTITRMLPKHFYVNSKSGEKIMRCINVPTIIKLYTTPIYPGARVINAVTGFKENLYTGKIDELNFFKISLSTGEFGSSHRSNVLFFDSPSQYETHFGVSLSGDIKSKWDITHTSYLNSVKD